VFSVIARDPKTGKDRVRNILIQETDDGQYVLPAEDPHRTYETLEDLVISKTQEGFQPILRDWCADS
jgi:hypothetical protein